ncbi:helix-turn-helix transcriptional regulator [Nocardia sp. NBC_00565]|uniref:helix-turn-helix transcriptional regulator n=1 Tax=Nocardia sp. NBC_00565 TaxID=2975993 RepID=UPI002E821654|nr:LuxR C-terminal-related transcriptional regulator [Nocardia sp. NBC_00565]
MSRSKSASAAKTIGVRSVRPLHDLGDAAVLRGLVTVLTSPLTDIVKQFSTFLATHVPHTAMVIHTADDVGHPLKLHGSQSVISCLVLSELDVIRSRLVPGGIRRDVIPVGGRVRPVLAALAETGALLLVVSPGAQQFDEHVLYLWQILALRIQQDASEASPSYLRGSRAASRVRGEAIAELADIQSTTLESLLAVLRSDGLDDRVARQSATNMAAEAMVNLRTATDRQRKFAEEPVTTAFERLRDDLRPLVRHRNVDVQFVEPPIDGRALPSEVAHGARAIVRGAISTAVDQQGVTRVRVQWDCDGKNLLINIRDDGPGDLTTEGSRIQPLRQRVLALNGELRLQAVAGWGSEISVVMPLDPPPVRGEDSLLWALGPRELEVLEHLATGLRNRAIANHLGISENTVKFHVSKIFRKLGVNSRAEATALMLEARVPLKSVVPPRLR